MKKIIDSYSKNNATYLLAGLALFFCTVFSGGLNWHGCLVSILILTALFLVRGASCGVSVITVSLVLLFSSCVSLFWTQSNVQDGIYEFIKFLCFVCALCVAKSFNDCTKILKIVFLNAVAVAVIGLLAICGIMNADEFTFYDGNVLRLQSFIKYANSTACFLGCGYISFLELFRKENKRGYLFGGGCILIALYYTFSKACIPIFLLISIAYLFFCRSLCSVFFRHNAIAVCALGVMLALSREKMWFLLFTLTALAIFLSGCARVHEDKKYFIVVCIAVPLFLILAVVVIALIRPSVLYTFAVRLTYMKDSLKLIPGNLFFGNGFGSWRVLQYAVQTTQYNVTYLHNGILQMFVENGAVFTVTFLGLCVFSVIKSLTNKNYVFAAIIALILTHSLCDCDLSFSSLLMVMGFAVGASLSVKTHDATAAGFVTRAGHFAIAAILVFSNLYALAEFTLRNSFENAYISGDHLLAEKRLSYLLRVCPMDADLKITSAALREENGAEQYLILDDINSAVALSPCEPGIYEAYMNYNITSTDTNIVCEKYLNMAPKQERTYVFLKQYLSNCAELRKITREEYMLLSELVEERRIYEKVTDRNDLLFDITGYGN